LRAARQQLIVYLDGDLAGLRPGLVTELCRPLMRDQADFVKARFSRHAGRVTELTAKPMLRVFFPELARFAQPLGGLIAVRRTLLATLTFEDGYGVDIGLLIDAHRAGARLVEVDIGALEHDSQPLTDLTAMANEVSRVIYSRARHAGRLHVEQISAMYESQRQATASLDYILSKRRGRTQLLLLAVDDVVIDGALMPALAAACLPAPFLGDVVGDAAGNVVNEAVPQFKFVHRQQIEQAAQALALRPGVVGWVNRMRRAGFMVGLVSPGPFVAAEVLRKRVFADFAVAHLWQFDADVCTGEMRHNAAFTPLKVGVGPALCTSHVVQRIRSAGGQPAVAEVWALTASTDDVPMLRAADQAFWLGAAPPLAAAQPVASFDDECLKPADGLKPRGQTTTRTDRQPTP
jgi:glucosyl-3-phosphoglycerate synthase